MAKLTPLPHLTPIALPAAPDPADQTQFQKLYADSYSGFMSGLDQAGLGLLALGSVLDAGESDIGSVGSAIGAGGSVLDTLGDPTGAHDPSNAIASLENLMASVGSKATTGLGAVAIDPPLTFSAGTWPSDLVFDISQLPSFDVPSTPSSGGGGGTSGPSEGTLGAIVAGTIIRVITKQAGGAAVAAWNGTTGTWSIIGTAVGQSALGVITGTLIPVISGMMLMADIFDGIYEADFEKWQKYMAQWFASDPDAANLYALNAELAQYQQQLAGFPAGQAERDQLEATIARLQSQVATLQAAVRARGLPPTPAGMTVTKG